MQVIEDVITSEAAFKNVVLSIGSFDGVHLGHRMIIERVVQAARACHGTAALMTLSPHPRFLFSPESAPNLLTSLDRKAELCAELGIDAFFVLRFDRAIANMERDAFLQNIIHERCGAKRLVVGHDFAFGRGAKGNYKFLMESAPALGIIVEEAPALILDGERVSSTRIRELILQGELAQAERYLGRKHLLRGTVEKGRGMGRQLGYPTANIKPHNNVAPANGIYAAQAVIDGVTHIAAVNVGIAPTIRHDDVVVEAFVLDFDADLVGKTVDVIFHKRLRPEKKFESLPELIEAIGEDVTHVREHFRAERVS